MEKFTIELDAAQAQFVIETLVKAARDMGVYDRAGAQRIITTIEQSAKDKDNGDDGNE